MNELAVQGGRRMTVKEVADVLGVQEQLIRKHVRELYPDLMINGVATYLDEAQITAVKQKMRPVTLVTGAITDLEAAEMLLRSAEHFKARFEQEHSARIEAEQRLAVAEPLAAFTDTAMRSKDVLSMGEAAKILKLGYGRNTFLQRLREMGIFMADNVPYQPYIDRGYFRVDETPILIGNNIRIEKTTKVKQKGLVWLFKKFASETSGTEKGYPLLGARA
jgi:phage antirepressor YoqD-like protein